MNLEQYAISTTYVRNEKKHFFSMGYRFAEEKNAPIKIYIIIINIFFEDQDIIGTGNRLGDVMLKTAKITSFSAPQE